MKRLAQALAALCTLTLGSGCVSTPPIQEDTEVGILRVCTSRYADLSDAEPPQTAAQEQASAAARQALQGVFSDRSLTVAAAIGALPTLQAFVQTSRSDRLAHLEIRLQLLEQMLKASIDVQATLTEIDCEGERGDRLRDQLVDLREQTLRRLALTGVVAGAATAVIGGTLALVNAATALQAGVDVVGGTVEASASAATLTDAPTARLRTSRNLLGDVWQEADESRLFRASVWRYLNDPNPRAAPYPTLRESLKAEWRSSGRLGSPDSPTWAHRTALLFGTGGYYSADDLQARDSILDLLETTVGRISGDLEGMMREVRALQ